MSGRPHILLTNDDGADSPLFVLTIEALSQLGELSIAVPASEQSWRGKSMSRVGTVRVEQIELAGLPAYSIAGTPADCVNIALHNLLDRRPDVVVSGANIGRNTGLGFVLSSGTVGGCLEGNIAGLPGLALSQSLDREVFRQWATERTFDSETIAHLRATMNQALPLVWDDLAPHKGAEPITWNVNFPYQLADNSVERTFLGHSFYDQCFQKRADGTYFHQVNPFEIDAHPDSDGVVVASGRISATKIDIRTLGATLEP